MNQRVSEVTLCSALEDMTAGEDSILPFNALSCLNVASNFNSFFVFYTLQKRKLQLSPEQCSNFYAEQFGKVFFPNLTAYMSSGPIVAMVLARNCAVSYWKELLGPSNSLRARITHAHR